MAGHQFHDAQSRAAEWKCPRCGLLAGQTFLTNKTPGLLFMGPFLAWARPYHRLNPDYERLKIQCVRAMSDLQSLQNQHTSALKRCEEVAKETDFYQ